MNIHPYRSQVLLVVIKLEGYFLVAFVIMYGMIDVHYEIPEFPLTIAIIPLLWIQVAMTIYFTKRENKFGAIMAIVSYFVKTLSTTSSSANRYM
jgi:uncharacterized RDD family membrane protein YckC